MTKKVKTTRNLKVIEQSGYRYQVKLVSDTSYGSLWEVSFTLKEF